MDKIIIYTCITGGYDSLPEPVTVPEDFHFVCFASSPEQFKSTSWELRPLPSSAKGGDKQKSRYPKFLPHEFFPDCRFSLWMDANIRISDPAFFDIVRNKVSQGVRFAAIRHPLRDDIYQEAEECIRIGRAALGDMKRVCHFLKSEAYPQNSGMTENNIILREHNDPVVVATDIQWKELFDRFPFRDQLLSGYCLKSHGIVPDFLLDEGMNSRNCPFLEYHVHPRKSYRIVRLAKEAVFRAKARKFRKWLDLQPDFQQLAIVIPAYRSLFLRQTLESISNQTDKRFRVYVGDDASPEDLRSICEDFKERIDLRYVRFDDNLGRTSLTAQWKRCVELSSEPWVWLFSDDDVMDQGCVRAFQSEPKSGCNLLRFNVNVIDSDGRVVERCDFPGRLSARKFARMRLQGKIRSYAVEYIFRRSAFDSAGGFVDFDLAWHSDDATWIRLSSKGGIRTIASSAVSWRRSGGNITSIVTKDIAIRKLNASLEYFRWLGSQGMGRIGGRLTWFVTSLFHFRNSIGLKSVSDFMRIYARDWGGAPCLLFERIYYVLKSRRRNENIHLSDL